MDEKKTSQKSLNYLELIGQLRITLEAPGKSRTIVKMASEACVVHRHDFIDWRLLRLVASLLRLFRFRDILNASPFALAFLLGALQLLQVSGISFSVMEHRMWFETPFNIGLNLEWPVVLLAIVCVGLLAMRRSLFLSLPLVSIVSYTVWGLSVAAPVVALVASLGGLLELRKWGSFAFTVLSALSAVELGAVAYWLIYAVVGREAPLSQVAYVEEAIFYILTPLSLIAMAAVVALCLVLPLKLLFVNDMKRAQGLAGPWKMILQREHSLQTLVL